MIADIGEVADTRIGWLLDDSSRFSLAITGEYPEELRVADLLAEGRIARLARETQYIRPIIEIITRYDDEFSGDMSLECEDRSTST